MPKALLFKQGLLYFKPTKCYQNTNKILYLLTLIIFAQHSDY
jgi:hypothetical protein